MENVGDKTKEGMFWVLLFKGVSFVVRMGSSIVLARLLFPKEFGLMGIASVVIQFARRFSNFGFNSALIQRKEIKDEHLNTVFISTMTLMGLITSSLFFGASWIADYFNEGILRLVMMVIAFNFVIEGLASVPRAILTREMKFKELETAGSVGEMFAMLSPIVFALLGFGVWSLVWGSVLGLLATSVMVISYARWIPKLQFRAWAFRDVFSFGVWVYVDNFLSYFVKNVDYFVIGKFLNATALGYYERAFNLMSMPRNQLVRSFERVMFSAYSRVQDDSERIIKAVMKVTANLAVITYPLMIWMYFASPSLIVFLYGANWEPTVLPLQIMCIAGILNTFSMIFFPLFEAKALMAQLAWRKLLYMVVLAAAVAIGLKWDIAGVAWGVTVASVFQVILMVMMANRHLGFKVSHFLSVQKSAIIYGLIQAVALEAVLDLSSPWFPRTSWIALFVVSAVSLIAYVIAHLIFRFPDVDAIVKELVPDIKKFLGKLPIIRTWCA